MTTIDPPSAEGVVTRASATSLNDTVDRLQQLIKDKDLILFTVVDHSGEARRARLEMPDTKLVVFGSPKAGTPLMLAAPLVALDLPLKLLVWEHEGQTLVSYNSPAFLARRHGLSEEQAKVLSGVVGLADAIAEPESEARRGGP
jgi:uncharacterized protein (DUF302 family)